MNFKEAYEEMLKGKKVRRKNWEEYLPTNIKPFKYKGASITKMYGKTYTIKN